MAVLLLSGTAPLESDPVLVELESKYLNKKFTDDGPCTGKGKKKRAASEHYVVHAISWSVEHDEWVAECVLLDSSGAVPESSKTAMGKVLREAVVYYICTCLDEMMD